LRELFSEISLIFDDQISIFIMLKKREQLLLFALLFTGGWQV
jgi:hypothetical protein